METARALWGLGTATVREVYETLASEKAVEFGTVQTYLRRLEAKGYVKSTLDGRVRVYAVASSRIALFARRLMTS